MVGQERTNQNNFLSEFALPLPTERREWRVDGQGCGRLAVIVVPPRLVTSNASCKAGTELAISKAKSTPPPVRSRTSLTASGPAFSVLVAPRRDAASSLPGLVSMAMISAAPVSSAARRAQHHLIARLQVCHEGAAFLNFASSFVAQNHRHRPRPVSVDNR